MPHFSPLAALFAGVTLIVPIASTRPAQPGWKLDVPEPADDAPLLRAPQERPKPAQARAELAAACESGAAPLPAAEPLAGCP